ncbi:MAG: hypothetical protein L6Q75_19680 [Burkholderiaceae bacterium]|nr:hypothetical protein [Burkholderiaceae bacterium]
MKLTDRLARLERLHSAEHPLRTLLLMRTDAGQLRRVDVCEEFGWPRGTDPLPFRDQATDEAGAAFEAAARAAGFVPLVLGSEADCVALLRDLDARV